MVRSKVGYGPVVYHSLNEQIPAYGHFVEYWRRTSSDSTHGSAHTHQERDSSVWQDLLILFDMQP